MGVDGCMVHLHAAYRTAADDGGRRDRKDAGRGSEMQAARRIAQIKDPRARVEGLEKGLLVGVQSCGSGGPALTNHRSDRVAEVHRRATSLKTLRKVATQGCVVHARPGQVDSAAWAVNLRWRRFVLVPAPRSSMQSVDTKCAMAAFAFGIVLLSSHRYGEQQ